MSRNFELHNYERGMLGANPATLTDVHLPTQRESVITLPEAAEVQFEQLGNQELPIFDHKAEIIEAMNSHGAIIVISPTGTGKSTQLPQYALEAGFEKIIETQPRRRAAQNVAERINEELTEVFGEEKASELVSFQTGAGLIGPSDARIKIVTDGLLVAQDAHRPSEGDNEMWIIDEVHENTQNTWLLLGIAKKKMLENPNFTVVVCTATPDKYKLISYLTDDNGEEPAVVELEGKMYDVEERDEPYSDVVKESIKAAIDIHENPDDHGGSNVIIVFDSGKAEIKDALGELRAKLPPVVLAKTTLLEGHAKMTPAALAPIYEDVEGIKIVVQTKMGSTSLTVNRTRYVITSGRERQPEIDDEDAVGLPDQLSSQDCIIQQRGRAGRTNTGIFVYTKRHGQSYVSMQDRDPHLTPEILRTKIDRIALYLSKRGEDIRTFDGIDKIPEARIERALSRNRVLGAEDEYGNITSLGKKMIKYPLTPERARSMVEAEDHGSQICLYMAALTASAETGGLRLFEPGGSRRWGQLSEETSSDELAQLDIFVAIDEMLVEDMHHFDIDTNNYLRSKELFRKIARRAGLDHVPKLIPPSPAERTILRNCIAAGYITSVFLPQGGGLFKKIGENLKPRELSNRSVVTQFTGSLVVGEARNVVRYKNGLQEQTPIIENVSEVTKSAIGQLAVHLTEWVPTGYTLRGGKYVQAQQQMLGPLSLASREVPAIPSPQLRAEVIAHIKVKPGKHLISLYATKSELERLAHRSRNQIPRLTEDNINSLIEEAAPDNVTDPSYIDEKLRQLIIERAITLDGIISFEEREKIAKDAPNVINIGEIPLKLRYQSGDVYVKNYRPNTIAALNDDAPLELPDGRQIYFLHDRKKYTLQQLKNKLFDEGLI